MSKSVMFWIAALGAVAVYYFFQSLSAIFFPFLVGLIGAYALDGTVSRLEKIKIRRGIGVF
jgi:predicted PurR-regulated permease PerM